MKARKVVSSVLAMLIILFFACEALAEQAAVPIRVAVGKGTVITLKEPSKRVSISNPEIADLNLVSPTELLLNGKKVGATSLIVWDSKGAKFFDVTVIENVDRIGQLREQIKELAPNDAISVELANDTIILSGHAANQQRINKAVQMAQAYALASEVTTTAKYSAGLTETETKSTGKVLNQIIIEEAQQVLLEVTVAQVNKTKLKQLGISVLIKGGSAEGTFPGFAGTPGGILGSGTSFNSSSSSTSLSENNRSSSRDSIFDNIFRSLISDTTTNIVGGSNLNSSTNTQTNTKGTSITGFDLSALKPQIGVAHFSSGVTVILNALSTNGLAKILAEPNMVVKSGERGNFHVGTRFPVQTVVGIGAAASVSVTYEEIGIRLNFAPEVLETGAIRLKVDPAEVSNIRDFVSNAFIVAPIIDTRTVKTSVDLKEGESLVLAGLLSEEMKKNLQKVPILGDIPILGALFRSTSDELDQNELVFFITPKLAKAIPQGVVTELPGKRPLTPEEEREYQWIPGLKGGGG